MSCFFLFFLQLRNGVHSSEMAPFVRRITTGIPDHFCLSATTFRAGFLISVFLAFRIVPSKVKLFHLVNHQGRVVRKPVNANPGLKVNRSNKTYKQQFFPISLFQAFGYYSKLEVSTQNE